MDIFQTAATTVIVIKGIVEFIDRYHTALRDAQDILARIRESELVLESVKSVVKKRKPPSDGQESEVIDRIRHSVSSCYTLLSKIKDVLENLESKHFERTRLVLGRKYLLEMQNDLANHVKILHLMLSVLNTLDADNIRVGVSEILNILHRHILSSQDALATSRSRVQTGNGRGDQGVQEVEEENSLTQIFAGIQLDDGLEALAGSIATAKTVQGSVLGEGASDSEDEGSLPQHTPSGANTPLDPLNDAPTLSNGLRDTADKAARPPEPHVGPIELLPNDILQKLIFTHRTNSHEEAGEGHLNQAEASMRQAIAYAEQLERRNTADEGDVKGLKEDLSSIFQKQGRWQESLSILTALLTSDAEADAVMRAWHDQLIGAAFFSKDVEEKLPSDPTSLERAATHALKAFRSRKGFGFLSEVELKRQRMCVELLVNIYKRLNKPEVADAFASELPPIENLTPGCTSVDHGGPARSHEARQKEILQAINERNQDMMRSLRPYDSADIECLDVDQTTTLFFAVIRCSDKESVECLLTHAKLDGLANAIDPGKERERRTALHVAARQGNDGNLHVIKSLLDHDADIDAQDKDGRTALLQAVDSNNLEAVKLLLGRGANREIADDDGWCVLHYAVHLEDVQMLKTLLKRASGLVNFTNRVEDAPIHLAVKQERADLVKILYEESEGLEVNASNTAGHYPLYLAAAHPLTDRRHKVFEELVRQGAKCDDSNPPPNINDYQKLSKARRLSDVSVATTLTTESDRGSPPRAGFLRRVLTSGSARA